MPVTAHGLKPPTLGTGCCGLADTIKEGPRLSVLLTPDPKPRLLPPLTIPASLALDSVFSPLFQEKARALFILGVGGNITRLSH